MWNSFEEAAKIYQENEKQLDKLVSDVVQLLEKHHCSIATAESCTGGMLSQYITSIPGASSVFAVGICTYTNAMKEKLLGVPPELLAQYTAVSPQTAAAMAKGISEISGADLCLSVTGFAGPSGGDDDRVPVGTVYLGVAWRGAVSTVHLPLYHLGLDTRERVRHGAAVCAFGFAKKRLTEECGYGRAADESSECTG